MANTALVTSEALARYGFPNGHPWGPDRQSAFLREFEHSVALDRVIRLAPREASREELELFHTPAHIDFVVACSDGFEGFLDESDTPAFRGVHTAAATVVGATLEACAAVMEGRVRHAFVPIAGLHHATRQKAAGFCVYNDLGVAVEWLRRYHGLRRIAYVDIDAHHGDGMFYSFEDDPELIFADLHEDASTLYPHTGRAEETGTGVAAGTKLNLPLAAGDGDAAFHAAWVQVEAHLAAYPPEFILLQAGADSLGGDPITHLALTEEAHAYAAARLCVLAEQYCGGRLVGTGGGGYNRHNLGRAWTRVVEAMVAT
jgi:acetoin utilization protein AcuC